MMKKTLCLILAAALAGCAGAVVTSEGEKLDKELVLSIKPGVTTRQAIIDMFGKPAEITNEAGTERFVYIFKEQSTPTYLGGMVENEAKTKVGSSRLEVVLKNDVVNTFRYKTVEE